MTLVFVLGGARSGKSRIAQELAETHAGPWRFVATAELCDEEMRERAARHKADRGRQWELIEASLDLPQVLISDDARGGTALVDCLTVWLGNLMHHGRNIEASLDELYHSLHERRSNILYVVSNEVGQGIVPDNAMAREFRDYAGRLNQGVARISDDFLFVTAGITQRLK